MIIEKASKKQFPEDIIFVSIPKVKSFSESGLKDLLIELKKGLCHSVWCKQGYIKDNKTKELVPFTCKLCKTLEQSFKKRGVE